MQDQTLRTMRPGLIALCIISCTTLVRLWFVSSGQLDLIQDESQYWDWTRRLQLSYYSKGPLIAWIIGFWTTIFGDTELGVRFGAVVNSAIAQGILYWGLAKIMGRPRVAVWTLVIANTVPLFLVSGILMTTDNPLLVCWSAALFCLYWAGERPDTTAPFILLAVAVALGILAKYMMLAILGVALLYVVGLWYHRMLPEQYVKRLAFALGAGTVIGFMPILLWNIQHDWVGIKHVSTLAGVISSKPAPLIRFDRFPEYIGAQIGLITPWWFVFMLVGGWHAFRQATSRQSGLRADRKHLRQSILFAAGFWMLWAFFFIWSFHKRIYPNWPAMSYVAGMILAAYAAEKGIVSFKQKMTVQNGKRTFRNWCVGLGVCIFILVHSLPYLPLPENLNPSRRLMGWHDLGQKITTLRDELPAPQNVFYFSDAYDLTASLAFYAPGQPFAFCADFGRRMSQYDLWPTPEKKIGWDAIYISKRKRTPPELATMFESMQVIDYRTSHYGRPGRFFRIIVLRHFNGNWPRKSFDRF